MTDGGVLEHGVMGGGVHILNRVMKESLSAIRCHDSRPKDGGAWLMDS